VKDPNDWSDGPPIHGHTTLEVIWTIVPAILVTAITIVSAVVLAQNSDAGSKPLKVKVVGQQFAWTFSYDNGKTYYPVLRLPVNETVKLDLQANDVIHSFWVPEFAQKQDAVPGTDQTLVITPTRVGTYPVICTELCGLGHSLMRSVAVVMPKTAFDKWKASVNHPGGGAAADPKQTFINNGCGACHTFPPIPSAKGTIGPELQNLTATAAKAGMSLEDYIRQSILDPNAFVTPGYTAGVMPSFQGRIPPADLDALVQYLAENAK